MTTENLHEHVLQPFQLCSQNIFKVSRFGRRSGSLFNHVQDEMRKSPVSRRRQHFPEISEQKMQKIDKPSDLCALHKEQKLHFWMWRFLFIRQSKEFRDVSFGQRLQPLCSRLLSRNEHRDHPKRDRFRSSSARQFLQLGPISRADLQVPEKRDIVQLLQHSWCPCRKLLPSLDIKSTNERVDRVLVSKDNVRCRGFCSFTA